jgi:hypothetical protein
MGEDFSNNRPPRPHGPAYLRWLNMGVGNFGMKEQPAEDDSNRSYSRGGSVFQKALMLLIAAGLIVFTVVQCAFEDEASPDLAYAELHRFCIAHDVPTEEYIAAVERGEVTRSNAAEWIKARRTWECNYPDGNHEQHHSQ